VTVGLFVRTATAVVVLLCSVPTSAAAASADPEVTVGGSGRVSASVVGVRGSPVVSPMADETVQPATKAGGSAGDPSVNFDGLAQDGLESGESSDVSSAVGRRDVVEAVNTRLAAYTRTGVLRCTVSLTALLGVHTDVYGPRVQYDPGFDRYVLVVSARSPDSALLYLAASRDADPCRTWWIYRLTFAGPLFPPGTRLDYPHLGQDPQALLLSSTNFRGVAYLGSAMFALPKSAVYAGTTFDSPTFPMPYPAAPVTAAAPGEDSFYVAAAAGRGYELYRMINSAGPGVMVLHEATIAAPFAAPTRPVRQCTGASLGPLDGRIGWQAVRVGDYVWFAHGVDAAGRPGVRYGAISLVSHSVHVAAVARSATSDDFNPSIGVSDAGYGLNYVWLNWAFTDPAARPCVDVSPVVDRVAPGEGVTDRRGTGTVLVRGDASRADVPFSAYSSVAVDPMATQSCPAGLAAVTSQQYFDTDGRWRTRIARFDFC